LSTSDAVFHRIINERTAAGGTRTRQKLIQRIQKLRAGRKLIVYTASPMHQFNNIMQQDIPLFEDMLRVASSEKGDLMINSPGGDPEAANRIIMMCRERFKNEFNVIVVNSAKSAATLIALGADKIFMGYLAELGPTDPQVQIRTPGIPQGQFIPAMPT